MVLSLCPPTVSAVELSYHGELFPVTSAGDLKLAMMGAFMPQQLADATSQAFCPAELVGKYSPVHRCHFLAVYSWTSNLLVPQFSHLIK